MQYLSLFSGVGGFELSIERAYESYFGLQQRPENGQGRQPESENNSKYFAHGKRKHGAVCCGFSENNKYATAIYRYNFPDHRNFGDATEIVCDELPAFDFLCAGFPCQSFSYAGKRKGFADTRGTMFFEVQRILADHRPRHFLLENVEGLVNHEAGKTFQTILGILTEIGYFVETVILDTKRFGVPQQRKRVFFIGHYGNECEREILSFGNDFAAIDNGMPKKIGFIDNNGDANRVYDSNYLARTLKSEGGGRGAKGGLYLVQKPRGFNDGGIKEICPTLSSNSFESNNFLADGVRIRRLTPTEFARLQGFEDSWARLGLFEDGTIKPISDTQQYKVFGNAISVPVVQAIIEKMIPCLENFE